MTYKKTVSLKDNQGLKHFILFICGIIISIISFGTLFLIEYSQLNYQINENLSLRSISKSISYCFLVACFEEFLFRYLFLKRWLQDSKKSYSINVIYLGIISSLIFGFLHLELSLFPKLQIYLALSAISLFYGVYKLRSIWIAIGMHFSWNLIEGVIFPFQGSGSNIESLFILKTKLNIWPENSNYMILSVFFELLILICLSRIDIFKITKVSKQPLNGNFKQI